MIDQKYRFKDLVTLNQLKSLLEKFSITTGYKIELATFPDNRVLFSNENRELSQKIHQSCPEFAPHCNEIKQQLNQTIHQTKAIAVSECTYGMAIGAAPVILDEKHVASFFLGNVLFEKFQPNQLKTYAEQKNCDSELFISTLESLPVITKEDFQQALLFVREITETLARKGLSEKRAVKAKKALAESNENLRITLNSIGDGVISTDLKGCIQSMNAVAQSLTGWSESQAKGKKLETVFKIVNANTRKTVENPIKEVLETGSVVYLTKHTVLIANDGREFEIADSAAPIKDKKGNTTGVVLVFRDVTHESLLESQSKKNERLLKDMFDSINDGISVLDKELNILAVNDWMKDRFRNHVPFEGKKCYEVYRKNDRPCESCPSLKAFESGQSHCVDVAFPDEENPKEWKNISAYPIKDESGEITGVIEYVKDISEWKFAEKELYRSVNFQKLVGRISSGFIMLSSQETDKEVQKALQEIGQFTGLDRVYVFLFNENESTMHLSNEWAASEIESLPNSNLSVSIDDFSTHFQQLKSNQDIYIPSFQSLPKEEQFDCKNILNPDVQSVLWVPMPIRERVIGFLGFDAIRMERSWSPEERSMMKMLGETIGHILERKRIQFKLENSELKHRAFLENFLGIVYQVSLKTFKPTFFYGQVEAITGYTSSDFIEGKVQWRDFIHPEDFQMIQEYEFRVMKEPGFVSDMEFRMVDRYGNVHWVRNIARLYRLDQDQMYLHGAVYDITQGKQAQQSLLQSEANLKSFFNTNIEFSWVVDLDGHIIDVNETVEKRLGWKKQELIGQSVLFVHPKRLHQQAAEVVQNMLQGKANFCSVPLITKSGQEIPVETYISKGTWDGKEVLFGVSKDISQLKESEAKYRALFDGIRDAILVHPIVENSFGNFIEVNEAACHRYGYSKDEMLNLSLSKISRYINLDENQGAEIINQFRQNKRVIFEDTHFTKSGLEIPVEINLGGFEFNGQKVLISLVRDISERKMGEQALRESEYKFRMLFENSPLGIYISRTDGQVLNANRALLKMLGSPSLEETLKINLLTYQPLIDVGYSELFQKCVSEGNIQKIQSKYTSKWGKIVELSVYLIPMKNERNEVIRVYTLMEDISEQKKAEEVMQRMQKLESVGTLAGGIAHDFNNLLMGIYGKIELAKSELPDYHLAYQQLDDAEKSMNRATRLTKQLLTFAKGGDPIKEDLRIDELIKEIARFDLSGSRVKAVFDIPDDLWYAKVDKGQIQQVFSNLIINAVQAMPSGGHIYITVQNQVIREGNLQNLAPGNYLKIIFSDEGEGIDTRNLHYIFDPYFTTKKTGTGLGLATCYSIINKHKGYIYVESELGLGTTFTLYLPATKFSKQTCIVKPEKQRSTLPLTGKVLVMDDEDMILDIVSEVLQSQGFTIETCLDGFEACKIYRQAIENSYPFDLVILDLTIPGGKGGRETAEDILKINHNAKLIVSSGYTNDSILSDYRDFGFKGYIEKPFGPKKLLEVITEVMYT